MAMTARYAAIEFAFLFQCELVVNCTAPTSVAVMHDQRTSAASKCSSGVVPIFSLAHVLLISDCLVCVAFNGQGRANGLTSECGRFVHRIEKIYAHDESNSTFLLLLQNRADEPAAWYPAGQVGSAAIAAFERDAATALRVATTNRQKATRWAHNEALQGRADAHLGSGDWSEDEEQEPERGGSDVGTDSGPADPFVKVGKGARAEAAGSWTGEGNLRIRNARADRRGRVKKAQIIRRLRSKPYFTAVLCPILHPRGCAQCASCLSCLADRCACP